ncbi:MAG: copper amine oxidase N-terminal domain-containing protein [Armatimonadota bacterium]
MVVDLAVLAVALSCGLPTDAQTWVNGVGPTCTPAELGRLGLLRNVHAYDQGGVTVAPVRGVAEVLGASVEYRAPKVVVRSADQAVTIEIEPGSRTARVNGRAEDMGAKAFGYSGITCAPVRFLVGRLGASVQYRDDWGDDDFAFGSNPRIMIGRGPEVFVLLVHEQPPDAVAKFIADMENTYQTDATPGATDRFYLGAYGVAWIVQVARLASDGRHFLSSCPEMWNEDSPLAPDPPDDGIPRRFIIGQGYVPPFPPREPRPGFWGNAAAIYGIRDGVWRHLISTQDVFPFEACERLGIARAVVRELDPNPP